jgi:hypothetical protein
MFGLRPDAAPCAPSGLQQQIAFAIRLRLQASVDCASKVHVDCASKVFASAWVRSAKKLIPVVPAG